MSRRRDGGQATVELALVLPVVALVLLAVIQVAIVARGDVVTVHAAREGARVAAVGAPDGEIRAAALARSDLPAARVDVTVQRGTETVTVTVRYRQATDVPLAGQLVGDAAHEASATMRREDVE